MPIGITGFIDEAVRPGLRAGPQGSRLAGRRARCSGVLPASGANALGVGGCVAGFVGGFVSGFVPGFVATTARALQRRAARGGDEGAAR